MCLEWMVFDRKFNVLFDMPSSVASHKGGSRKHLRSPPPILLLRSPTETRLRIRAGQRNQWLTPLAAAWYDDNVLHSSR